MDKRVYAINGSCPPLCLCTCVMTGGPRTGGHSPANKSRSHKSSNISPVSTHDTIKSHITTCCSMKWCHKMVGTVPRSHLCNLLLLPLSILESNIFSSYVFLPKAIKKNIFRIPCCDKYAMTVMPLFKNTWWTVCLYLSMCVQFKWVGSDKLFESVLRLMDINVIANFRYHV